MADINFIGTPDYLIPLGKILSYSDNKNANLFVLPMPGEDASETEAIDSLGIVQYITIEGRMTGDFSSIQTKMAQLKRLADGFQMAAFTFKSPFVSSVESIYTYTDTWVPNPITPYTFIKVTVPTKTGVQLRIGNIGTNTSISTNTLIDSTAAFVTWGTQVGDKVKNMTTGEVATITTIS